MRFWCFAVYVSLRRAHMDVIALSSVHWPQLLLLFYLCGVNICSKSRTEYVCVWQKWGLVSVLHLDDLKYIFEIINYILISSLIQYQTALLLTTCASHALCDLILHRASSANSSIVLVSAYCSSFHRNPIYCAKGKWRHIQCMVPVLVPVSVPVPNAHITLWSEHLATINCTGHVTTGVRVRGISFVRQNDVQRHVSQMKAKRHNFELFVDSIEINVCIVCAVQIIPMRKINDRMSSCDCNLNGFTQIEITFTFFNAPSSSASHNRFSSNSPVHSFHFTLRFRCPDLIRRLLSWYDFVQ